ncbi:MAG: hypothetical protein GX851_02150 [Clostridiales bacterium]|nr:hypothetical protein [Clostridiales bacterium]
MDNDIIFKSAIFGGFKKDAVMSCIDALTAEKVAAARDAEANRAALHAVNLKLRELEQQLSSLTAENAALAAVKLQFETADAQNSEMSARISALTAENEEKSAKLEAIEAERDALKSDCERLHSVETQLGAAIIDARRYSDQLVDEAKRKAQRVSGDAGAFLEETADKVSLMTSDINNISDSFNRTFAELLTRINTLTGNLGDAAKTLLDGPPEEKTEVRPETETVSAQMPSGVPVSDVQLIEYDSTEKVDGVYLFGTK